MLLHIEKIFFFPPTKYKQNLGPHHVCIFPTDFLGKFGENTWEMLLSKMKVSDKK